MKTVALYQNLLDFWLDLIQGVTHRITVYITYVNVRFQIHWKTLILFVTKDLFLVRLNPFIRLLITDDGTRDW